MTNKHLQKFLSRAATEVHLSHLSVIGTFAFVLISVLAVRGEISLNPFRALANKTDTLTYEEAKAQVAMEMGDSQVNFDAMSSQLAMVDPNAGDRGAVLGMTTGLNIADPIDQVLPKSELDKIILITTDDNSIESFNRYSTQVVYIESTNNMIGVLSALNSDNETELATVQERTSKMIGMMKGIEVPTELVEYHKLKLVYYASLSEIAKSFLHIADVGLDDSTKVMLSIMDRLGAIKLEIYSKYKIVI